MVKLLYFFFKFTLTYNSGASIMSFTAFEFVILFEPSIKGTQPTLNLRFKYSYKYWFFGKLLVFTKNFKSEPFSTTSTWVIVIIIITCLRILLKALKPISSRRTSWPSFLFKILRLSRWLNTVSLAFKTLSRLSKFFARTYPFLRSSFLSSDGAIASASRLLR